MTEPIPAAVLGTGHGHALGKMLVLQDSPEWELVGVCEPDPELHAQRQGEKAWAGVRWLEAEELLGDRRVRMVAVESEVPQLLQHARWVIDAGKHLHLDKPAGTDLPFFSAVLSDARRQQLVVQMGYMFRYHGGFDLIRRVMAEGWLGRVHCLHACIPTDHKPDARAKLAFHPGGMMLELGCHLIDMLVLLMGRPVRVTPFLRHDGRTEDTLADNALAVFEFEHAYATPETSAMEPQPFPRRMFEVIGDEGSIVVQPLEPPTVRLCLREAGHGFAAGWQEVPVETTPRYERDLADLAACIREERPLEYDYEHDYTVQETVLRACGVI